VSDWRLTFAHRGRDQSLVEALCDQRTLPKEEREVARGVLFDLATEPGFDTIGDALDHIEGMSASERRRLLNEAGLGASLATVEQIEAQQRFAQACDAARL
jgi:hypothetical protein